ncbi:MULTISPECIES: helix-turn-helix domain-containing protein [unclassified Curtobacterium]|uniref:helix-turn-helix domain-containing protein n=1 Tax=unclassified Curtobacterium TaxID=257496 RepID=UPI00381544D2
MTAAGELAGIGIQLDQQDPRVQRALVFIVTHYLRPITVAEIRNAAGCSERTLQARFRSDLAMHPSEAVLRLRLQRARQILQQSSGILLVKSVAQSVGIAHAGRFAVRYREQYGETPTQTLHRRLDGDWAERAKRISRTPFPWRRE